MWATSDDDICSTHIISGRTSEEYSSVRNIEGLSRTLHRNSKVLLFSRFSLWLSICCFHVTQTIHFNFTQGWIIVHTTHKPWDNSRDSNSIGAPFNSEYFCKSVDSSLGCRWVGLLRTSAPVQTLWYVNDCTTTLLFHRLIKYFFAHVKGAKSVDFHYFYECTCRELTCWCQEIFSCTINKYINRSKLLKYTLNCLLTKSRLSHITLYRNTLARRWSSI